MYRGLFRSTQGADSMLMRVFLSSTFFRQMPAAAAICCFNFCVRGSRRIEIPASKNEKEYFKMNGQRRLTEWPGEVDNLAPGQKLVSGPGQIQLTHTGTVGQAQLAR